MTVRRQNDNKFLQELVAALDDLVAAIDPHNKPRELEQYFRESVKNARCVLKKAAKRMVL